MTSGIKKEGRVYSLVAVSCGTRLRVGYQLLAFWLRSTLFRRPVIAKGDLKKGWKLEGITERN